MKPSVVRHIAEMKIVIAKGCTLQDAKAELDRLEWAAAEARLRDKQEGCETRLRGPSPASHQPSYWWQNQ